LLLWWWWWWWWCIGQEKLGVDEKTLRGLNPKLIYAQITGYGLEDPRAGYDAVIQVRNQPASLQ
jgi:crotonobetainyl-CoA:carnitine CoA-transferase CaiB-like acyl-CoA transferase